MREPLRDQLRLLHIQEACERIKTYYPNNQIPLLSPKSIEFSHSATSWNDIVRMRHLLVHGYYHISPEIVKEIAETELPLLEKQVRSYLSEFSE